MRYKLLLALALLAGLNTFAQQDEKWQKEVNDYLSIVSKERQNGVTDTLNYLSALYELSILYYEAERYEDVVVCSLEADSLFRKMVYVPIGFHISLLSRLAKSFSELKDYYNASSAQFAMLSLEEFVFNNGGRTIDNYKVKLQDIVEAYRIYANYTRQIPDMETTKLALLYACRLMEENNIVDSSYIYSALGSVYLEEDSLELAYQYFLKEYSISHDSFYLVVNAMSFSSKALDLIAEKGDFISALHAYLIYNDCLEIIGYDTSLSYISNRINIADCYNVLGEYAKALTILEDAETLIEKYHSYDKGLHMNCLTSSAEVLDKLALHKDAMKVKQKYVDLAIQDSIIEYRLLFYQAEIQEYKKNVDSTIIIYNKIISKYIKEKGAYCIELLFPYDRLLMLYDYLGDNYKYDSILERCYRILDTNSNNPKIGLYESHLYGTIAYIASANRWDNAEEKWKEAVYSYETYGNTWFANYTDVLVSYAYESFRNGHKLEVDVQKALIYYGVLQYGFNYSQLSTIERDSIIRQPIYIAMRDMIFSLICDSSDMVGLYNYVLFCKQQTLNTDVEFAKTTLERNQTPSQKSNSHDERVMRLLASQTTSMDWMFASYDSIRNNLDRNDIAVEYIRYDDYQDIAKNKIPTERYIALVAKKNWPEPKLVSLCTADELRNFVSSDIKNEYIKNVYSGGYVSNEIVRLLFDPISVYANKGGHVYFSPDGVLCKLAIENILDEDSITFGQKYNLIRCSSTRDIKKIKGIPLYANAVLYGGLEYGDTNTSVAKNSIRKGWYYLQGTLKELTAINGILKRNKIKIVNYSGKEGTEESFIGLSGKETSIIHLATHGFFYEASSAQKESYFENFTRKGSVEQNTEIISPMERSGLMFSNGNRAWMTGDNVDGEYDGVLLASEVTNLNLFGTKLLVLSACETGLGDLSVEGVFGLQRAFKLAGVETIVMSLWEVDDAATALMMEHFYKNLMAGKSKRESFTLAQQKVIKKYPTEPEKWAAFIMLD